MKNSANNTGKTDYPKTISEAVSRLVAKLPFKEKSQIAKMGKDDLINLNFSLGLWIKNNFGLWSKNESLIQECCKYHGEDFMYIHEDESSMIIIYELWQRLQVLHKIRIVK